MAKRFTDRDKWDDPWFRNLKVIYKSLWEFLRDKCDNAGFWKKDFEAAYFFIGERFEPQDALKAFNVGKVRVVDRGDYWELVDFTNFQYGELDEACNPHKPIIKLLEKYRNKGYFKGTSTLEEQEKDKEYKGGVGEKAGSGVTGEAVIGVKIKHLEYVFLKDQENQQLIKELGSVLAQKYIEKLNDYIGSKGKKYKSHFHTIRNWHRKDLEEGKIKKPSQVNTANEALEKIERWKRGEE